MLCSAADGTFFYFLFLYCCIMRMLCSVANGMDCYYQILILLCQESVSHAFIPACSDTFLRQNPASVLRGCVLGWIFRNFLLLCKCLCNSVLQISFL